jgi:hypothetical protein
MEWRAGKAHSSHPRMCLLTLCFSSLSLLLSLHLPGLSAIRREKCSKPCFEDFYVLHILSILGILYQLPMFSHKTHNRMGEMEHNFNK